MADEPPTRPPRVFISYAHDSPEHVAAVRRLWSQLRAFGIDARIDLLHAETRRDWTHWLREEFEQADVLLVVASPLYAAQYQEGDKSGVRAVTSYAAVISELVYAGSSSAGDPELVTFSLPGRSYDEVPPTLATASQHSFAVDDLSASQLEPLIRFLVKQPYEVSQLGRAPLLPPREPLLDRRLAEAGDGGMSARAVRALVSLLPAGRGLTVKQLARRLNLSLAGTYRVLHDLEHRLLVRRRPDSTYMLTDLGVLEADVAAAVQRADAVQLQAASAQTLVHAKGAPRWSDQFAAAQLVGRHDERGVRPSPRWIARLLRRLRLERPTRSQAEAAAARQLHEEACRFESQAASFLGELDAAVRKSSTDRDHP